jgi:hypothetical protein
MATAPSFISEQETALNNTTPKNVAASITASPTTSLVEVAAVEAAPGRSAPRPAARV